MKKTYLVLVVFVSLITGCEILGWQFRFFVNLVIWTGLPLLLIWLVFDKKKRWVKEGAKLCEKGRGMERLHVEYGLRGACLVFAFFLIFVFCVPIIKDTFDVLSENAPISVQKKVKQVSSFMGLSFIGQSILLEGDNTSYSLFFSVKPVILKNLEYVFLVLPSSGIVVDCCQPEQASSD
ncbi:MAG: hypothetical protein PHO37_07180 [Kiritimatiellae bacterium]|nr:hypothetical protein [Kiritimatiellia bacterium]